jgi:serine/threonine-protein kinase HipA
VHLCKHERALVRLVFAKDGTRGFSQFSYSDDWLTDSLRFDVSPDLGLHSGFQLRKAPTPQDSCFFGALADTEPDAWGRRVIARAHAKKRAITPNLAPLSAMDYLAAVDDLSRVGAPRLRMRQVSFYGSRHLANGQPNAA